MGDAFQSVLWFCAFPLPLTSDHMTSYNLTFKIVLWFQSSFSLYSKWMFIYSLHTVTEQKAHFFSNPRYCDAIIEDKDIIKFLFIDVFLLKMF